jgi:DNA topoisomerase-1
MTVDHSSETRIKRIQMEQLTHNGVMVPPRYQGHDLTIKVKGQTITLNEQQEERAMAWAKKIGTPYVEDPEFADNFHKDFSEILGTTVLPGDVDYTEIHQIVLDERETRANMTREEKKALAAQRKEIREANKEKYGWATIDGERTQLGNYTVEPSSIFMGRGQHPMRGKWKEGPRHGDIALNHSPEGPQPPGDWKEIRWEPDTMWIARWKDKLSNKTKYVWPHDSSPIKQRKDIEKFDKALEFRRRIKKVKAHINDNLDSEDPTRKKTATVTFLIDHCKFRVGDEKDDDEAETIGASTLRPEHINFNGDGTVTFNFLGKDSVRHTLCVEVPDPVIDNLKEFSANPEKPLFEGVDSKRVSDFLDEVMTGLSAKVFRTHYATTAVETKLNRTRVDPDAPEYVKKHAATMANLEAAKVCNHKRTIPKTWEQSLQKKRDRLKARRAKAREKEKKIKLQSTQAGEKYRERLKNYQLKLEEHNAKLEAYKVQLEEKKQQEKSTKGLVKRIASKKKAIKTQRERTKNLKIKHKERIEKLKVRLITTKDRDRNAIEKLKLQITAQAETRDYNLGTSMKSYVDPRIYYNWSRKVDYDWRKYYSKTLQSKFSWIDPEQPPAQ